MSQGAHVRVLPDLLIVPGSPSTSPSPQLLLHNLELPHPTGTSAVGHNWPTHRVDRPWELLLLHRTCPASSCCPWSRALTDHGTPHPRCTQRGIPGNPRPRRDCEEIQQENHRQNAKGQRLKENISCTDGAWLAHTILLKEEILSFISSISLYKFFYWYFILPLFGFVFFILNCSILLSILVLS